MIRLLDWLIDNIELPSPLELLICFLGSLIGCLACSLYYGSWAAWQGAVIGGTIANLEMLVVKRFWK